MATNQLSRVIHHLRQATARPDAEQFSDGHLLERFITGGDGPAFEALVSRHGPMVLGVCRRMLGNLHDAEDAFQAVFLVLASKAGCVKPRELVGSWLYTVAVRTALHARTAKARRQVRERQASIMPETVEAQRDLWLDLQPILDEELSRLPERYRVPIILCELEGRRRKDVARQLGIPEGTLSSRLATARKRLAGQLTRRGLALSGGVLASLFAQQVASAEVPATLASSTVKAATLIAAGETAAAGLVSANAAALAQGVMKGMFLFKLKIAVVVVAAAALFGSATSRFYHQALADNPPAAGDREKPRDGEPAKGREGDGDKPKGERDGEKPRGERDGEKPRGERDGEKPRGERDGEKPRGEGDSRKPGAGQGEMVTLTGKVTEEKITRKRDDGSELKLTAYYLTDAMGQKVPLPLPRRRESGELLDKFDLSQFVGKEVTLTGRALTARVSESNDAARRVTRVLAITDIKEKK